MYEINIDNRPRDCQPMAPWRRAMVSCGMPSEPVIAPEIAAAVAGAKPVVALETTLIAYWKHWKEKR